MCEAIIAALLLIDAVVVSVYVSARAEMNREWRTLDAERAEIQWLRVTGTVKRG